MLVYPQNFTFIVKMIIYAFLYADVFIEHFTESGEFYMNRIGLLKINKS